MNKIFVLLFLFFLASCSSMSGKSDLCETLKLRCEKSISARRYSRSTSASMPTFSSAFSSNPSTIATQKGFGVEVLHYNDPYAHVIMGTGIAGAGFSSSISEDTFFGVVPMEEKASYQARRLDNEKYKAKNKNLNLGFNILGGKKNDRNLKINVGTVFRYHKELKNFNYGGAASIKWRFLHGGANIYNDEYKAVTDVYDFDSGSAGFTPLSVADVRAKSRVLAMTAGINLGVLMFDYTLFKREYTKYSASGANASIVQDQILNNHDPETNVYSVSGLYHSFVFTYGYRKEIGTRSAYNSENKTFDINNRSQSDSFLGLQFQATNFLLLSAFMNYYLVDDLTLGLTFFF